MYKNVLKKGDDDGFYYMGVTNFMLLWLSLYGPRVLWRQPEDPCCLQQIE
jgi:hypothetical protein